MTNYAIVEEMMKYLGVMVVAMIATLLLRIFTVLAIGEDAKAIGVKERTLYMIFAFFFPPIVAIVYLCTRKNAKKIQPKICDLCGLTVDTTTTICPKCSGVMFTDYLIPNNEKHRKNSKLFTIIAAVAFSIIVIVNVCFTFMSADLVKEFGDLANENGYSQNLDDYFKNFGLEEPQDGDGEEYDEDNNRYKDFQDYFDENFGE